MIGGSGSGLNRNIDGVELHNRLQNDGLMYMDDDDEMDFGSQYEDDLWKQLEDREKDQSDMSDDIDKMG